MIVKSFTERMKMKLLLANISGNLPCLGFLFSGVYLIEKGFFKTGIFLLIVAASTVVSYKSSQGKEEKNQ